MADLSRLASSENVVACCLVPWGVTAYEGFDRCRSLLLRGCYMPGSADSFLYGEVECNAGLPFTVACGRWWIGFHRVPSMESCPDALSTLRGEALSRGEPKSVAIVFCQRGVMGGASLPGRRFFWRDTAN